ncbi:hypothetical protein BaRGS_00026724 [Batillaria attramentaria]|uniref:Uncharacterized protein n=1 Tax=Batillaria attramentaria TaxID=370345 RepID=A0ABD0K3P4_9CAEN
MRLFTVLAGSQDQVPYLKEQTTIVSCTRLIRVLKSGLAPALHLYFIAFRYLSLKPPSIPQTAHPQSVCTPLLLFTFTLPRLAVLSSVPLPPLTNSIIVTSPSLHLPLSFPSLLPGIDWARGPLPNRSWNSQSELSHCVAHVDQKSIKLGGRAGLSRYNCSFSKQDVLCAVNAGVNFKFITACTDSGIRTLETGDLHV